MSALPRAMYGVMKDDSVALLPAHKSFSIRVQIESESQNGAIGGSRAVHCGLCNIFSALNDDRVAVAESAAS